MEFVLGGGFCGGDEVWGVGRVEEDGRGQGEGEGVEDCSGHARVWHRLYGVLGV